jgi:N-acetylglutamate synthase-like GNAT family acetyltransferase
MLFIKITNIIISNVKDRGGNMKVEPLSANMHFFNDVANLKFQAFSHLNPGETIDDLLEHQSNYLNHIDLPIAYVVLDYTGELLGTFTIKDHYLNFHSYFTPWLGSVVVPIEKRNQGVGKFIVESAEAIAESMGFPMLYLFTSDQSSWYSNLGWETVEHSDFNGFLVTVMSKKLNVLV